LTVNADCRRDLGIGVYQKQLGNAGEGAPVAPHEVELITGREGERLDIGRDGGSNVVGLAIEGDGASERSGIAALDGARSKQEVVSPSESPVEVA